MATNEGKTPEKESVLYYGDNLDVLRRYVADESVDLVYLDPPFNSAQDYNVLFQERDGERAAAQIKAFGDTWTCISATLTGRSKPSGKRTQERQRRTGLPA